MKKTQSKYVLYVDSFGTENSTIVKSKDYIYIDKPNLISNRLLIQFDGAN